MSVDVLPFGHSKKPPDERPVPSSDWLSKKTAFGSDKSGCPAFHGARVAVKPIAHAANNKMVGSCPGVLHEGRNCHTGFELSCGMNQAPVK